MPFKGIYKEILQNKIAIFGGAFYGWSESAYRQVPSVQGHSVRILRRLHKARQGQEH